MFTFGVTPADLEVPNMAAKQFLIYILAHMRALVGLEYGIKGAAASQCDKTDALPNEICRFGSASPLPVCGQPF